jgi:hypothetical protein
MSLTLPELEIENLIASHQKARASWEKVDLERLLLSFVW